MPMLAKKVLEKVWGTPNTEPWHENPERTNVGEVWFEASDRIPLLVKFLFTSENLSVQVHPRDEYARQHHDSCGKTEMWHVLRAEGDARIAVSVKEQISPDRLRESALSGEIVGLLNWVPVQAGDTFFTPAGTIHALGAGLTVCEVQQYSDITYRLYDYGRPRELHLDHGVAVSDLHPYDASKRPIDLGSGRTLLAECGYFRTERWDVQGSTTAAPKLPTIFIALEGSGTVAGQHFRAGDAFESGPEAGSIRIESDRAVFLVTSQQGEER